MTVGERIKQIREEKKISQTELAEAINTTKQNIYKYENNIISNIPSDKIEAIAKYLSVSPAYLMGWENDNSLITNIPQDILDHFNGNVEQAYKAWKARTEYEPEEQDENLIILNRNAKKLTPEKRKQLLDMAKVMFEEEFDD